MNISDLYLYMLTRCVPRRAGGATGGEQAQFSRAAYQGQTERGGGRRTRIDIPHVEVPTAEDILKMRSQYSDQVGIRARVSVCVCVNVRVFVHGEILLTC